MKLHTKINREREEEKVIPIERPALVFICLVILGGLTAYGALGPGWAAVDKYFSGNIERQLWLLVGLLATLVILYAYQFKKRYF